jgi:sugar-specific transcriptional regulator TrmB
VIKVIEEMIKSGLQEYESKAYYALLTRGNLNAKEISIEADIPQPKVYTVMSNLIKKGFCNRVSGHKKQYKALEPKVAFSLMKNEIERKRKDIGDVIERLEDIYSSENLITANDYVDVLKNNQQIYEKFISLLSNVENEIVGLIKPPFASLGQKDRLDYQQKIIKNKLKHGLDMKMIYEFPNDSNKEGIVNLIETSIMSGEKSKMIKTLPIKVLIFDEKKVLMTLNNPHSEAIDFTAIIVEHADLAKVIKLSFDFLWDAAVTLEEYKLLHLEK